MNLNTITQWKQASHQFRTGVRTLHRLGALEQVCDEVEQLRRLWVTGALPRMATAPDWRERYWLTLLSTCIHEGRYTQELLRGFALSAAVTLDSGLNRPTSEGVVTAMEDVFKYNHKYIRRSFYKLRYSEVKSDE
jgi:hypothetical protein